MTTVKELYGDDADFLAAGWSSVAHMVSDNLTLLRLEPQEWQMLEIMLKDRYSLRRVIRPLRAIAAAMNRSYRQAARWLARLRARGLVATDHQPGRELIIDLSPLLGKLRELIHLPKTQPGQAAQVAEEPARPARDTQGERISLLLDAVANEFGEWIGNKPMAMARLCKMQNFAGWSFEQMHDATISAVKESLSGRAKRKLSAFFGIMDRQAREWRIRRIAAEEQEQLDELYDAANLAHEADEPDRRDALIAQANKIEKKRRHRREKPWLVLAAVAGIGGA